MVMQPPKGQNVVKIPLDPDIEIKSSSTTVQGGTVYIVVEDTDPDPDVTEYKVTIRSSPPKLAPMPEVTR